MFGYVVCDKDELKVRQYNTYKAHYCGVCKAMKRRYGIMSCALLSYDAAAFSIMAGCVGECEYKSERCIVNPAKKVAAAHGACVDFAADANVFLSTEKLRDNARDEARPWDKVLEAVSRGLARRSEQNLGIPAQNAKSALQTLYALEAQDCFDIDLTANSFGECISAVFNASGAADTELMILKSIAFNLGRWLYIIDAADDLDRDEKSGCYNIFLKKYESAANARQNTDIIEYNAVESLAQAGAAAELLQENDCSAILLNIIDGGAYNKTNDILHPKEAK